jgi:hypothetical protein
MTHARENLALEFGQPCSRSLVQKRSSRIWPTLQQIVGPVMRMYDSSPSASHVYYANNTFALLLIRNGCVLHQRFLDSSCLIQHDAPRYLPSMPLHHDTALEHSTPVKRMCRKLRFFNLLHSLVLCMENILYCLFLHETT